MILIVRSDDPHHKKVNGSAYASASPNGSVQYVLDIYCTVYFLSYHVIDSSPQYLDHLNLYAQPYIHTHIHTYSKMIYMYLIRLKIQNACFWCTVHRPSIACGYVCMLTNFCSTYNTSGVCVEYWSEWMRQRYICINMGMRDLPWYKEMTLNAPHPPCN